MLITLVLVLNLVFKNEDNPYYWYEGVKIYDNLTQFVYGELEADPVIPKIPEDHAFEIEQ